ncbi:MAG: multiheme c-type cytochrome [Anaerolineales bacterium]
MRRFLYVLLLLSGVLLVSTMTLSYAQREDAPDYDERTYEGVGECNACHRGTANDHRDTLHAMALSDDPESILADFESGADLRTVTFPGEDDPRPFTAEDVAYVMGAGRYVQAYVTELNPGEYVVFPAEWNTQQGEWVSYEIGDTWPEDPAYNWNTQCAGCHTTGLQQTDEGIVWEDDGVQCEACHGPGSEHVAIANDLPRRASPEELAAASASILDGTDPQVCGQCHARGTAEDGEFAFVPGFFPFPGQDLLAEDNLTLIPPDDPAHWWPTGHARSPNMGFNEWLMSGHSEALTNMQASGGAAERCFECHSTDGARNQAIIAEFEAGEREGLPPEPLTVETAQHGVTCVACHDMHQEELTDFHVVEDTYPLCTSCHTDPDLTDRIHYPTQQMFEGVAVVDEVEPVPGAHFAAEDGPDCQSCHMPRVPVASFSLSSHSMQIVSPGIAGDIAELDDSCTVCHGEQAEPAAMQRLIDDTQASNAARIAAIEEALTGNEPEWVGRAFAFVADDTSLGVHNYAYSDALLDAIEAEIGIFDTDTEGNQADE